MAAWRTYRTALALEPIGPRPPRSPLLRPALQDDKSRSGRLQRKRWRGPLAGLQAQSTGGKMETDGVGQVAALLAAEE
ncbi:hypothetical protein GGTG_09824 [Gaeumannomyces tritici R3-111a-1]|uniref:Uncharacterized protein n=1 Tax=Gaeumannomyces tritici (strain R3-111a-1) TaxID=644352 RepID=J3P8J0_GAET3|nr:hypothetical protein GGTG_09824 [Gaeumannomyces tritici R3-111a-1]EJT72973.1 hypothetical protein GGTG_09824 [Gaeumannomyces tritici R3-111a-1]